MNARAGRTPESPRSLQICGWDQTGRRLAGSGRDVSRRVHVSVPYMLVSEIVKFPVRFFVPVHLAKIGRTCGIRRRCILQQTASVGSYHFCTFDLKQWPAGAYVCLVCFSPSLRCVM